MNMLSGHIQRFVLDVFDAVFEVLLCIHLVDLRHLVEPVFEVQLQFDQLLA